jgi:hypothetical protein
MRFGTKFWLRRGAIDRHDGVGRSRFVAARLLFARGCHIYAELLEDDPGSADPGTCQAGQRGWWGRTSVRTWEPERPVAHANNFFNDGWRRGAVN